eukprot:TRINITY_DN22942_c1_g2_i1.p1 TRINITY_DN22942_c1_g2~~TRINITY_DN22942_c1_g2_i1.p1  ORF type:complete len:260 (+),score=50.22 TRINITY_DN22942_c1_g2_i1:35-781(+)
MARRFCYRRCQQGADIFLCLAQEGLENFVGDALVTSTNCRLEGINRRNWWGFAGRRSADAALHEKAGPSLLQACHAVAEELTHGVVIVTPGGPNLKVSSVLHVAVPSHPDGRDPRPLPPHMAAEYVDPQDALLLLRNTYKSALQRATELHVKSLACPAIGCGCRGFPLAEAAEIGLAAIVDESSVPFIEVRFWDHATFMTWREKTKELGLEPCEEYEVQNSLWGGETLEHWSEKKQKSEKLTSLCPLM